MCTVHISYFPSAVNLNTLTRPSVQLSKLQRLMTFTTALLGCSGLLGMTEFPRASFVSWNKIKQNKKQNPDGNSWPLDSAVWIRARPGEEVASQIDITRNDL